MINIFFNIFEYQIQYFSILCQHVTPPACEFLNQISLIDD